MGGVEGDGRSRAVRAILLELWDPIGIVELGGPEDEYDSYVWPIINLVDRGAGERLIAAQLLEIETGRMGLRGDGARCDGVAEAIVLALGQTPSLPSPQGGRVTLCLGWAR